MDSFDLIDEIIKNKSIVSFYFLYELQTLVNKVSITGKLEDYFRNNPDYKKAIDFTLNELIKKIQKIEKGKKGRSVKPFHNRIGNDINFNCLKNLEGDLFEITQKPVSSVTPNNIDYLSDTKGPIRFLISPKQKMLALMEHKDQNTFDKCCLFKYSLIKNELLIEPYGWGIQGIIEVYPYKQTIVYKSILGKLRFWDGIISHPSSPYIENTSVYNTNPLLSGVLHGLFVR